MAAILLLCAGNAVNAEVVRLGELDLAKMSRGWGRPQVDKSVTGKTLSIGGRTFDHGVGTHAESTIYVDLDGKAEQFKAYVGVDDAAGRRGSIRFMVYGDSKRLFDSGVMKGGQEAKAVDVPWRACGI
jgi:alpha-galactosidase